MPITSTLSHVPAVPPSEPMWRWTVEQYHALLRSGVLTEDDPIELLDGWLVTKMGKNPPHSVVADLIRRILDRTLPPGWHARSQDPITLSASEPEPDVAVVRGEPRQYLDRHPSPAEVAMVVEVADASLRRDRTLKKRLYAEAGIPVYWIVNLGDRLLEVYSDPTGPAKRPGYRQHRDCRADDEVMVPIEDREFGPIRVGDFLP